jgi:hypothetical protein
VFTVTCFQQRISLFTCTILFNYYHFELIIKVKYFQKKQSVVDNVHIFILLFPYFPIFSLICVYRHLFSAENFSVYMYNFIHFHVQNLYTSAPLQDLCKQKRSVSRHFFIFDINTNLNENNKEMS